MSDILSALSKQFDSNAIGALDQHDGSILDDVLGALGKQATAQDGSAILGHVLGARQNPMEQALSGVSGLSPQNSGQLMAMLAPIVMGYLGRQTQSQGLDAGSLASMLGQAATHARRQQREGASVLTSLLDRDGDGSIVDDLGQMGMGILGGLLKRQ